MRFIIFFLLLLNHSLYGQSSLSVQGQVMLNEQPLEAAHISNLNSQESTTSDKGGVFSIHVDDGDILLISHIAAQEKYVVMYDELMEKLPFLISMQAQTNTLDEVILEEGQRVTVQSVGIVQGEQYIPTTNERRLHTSGDFKAVHLLGLLGGSLAVDPIINAINGKTKRLKRYIEIDGEIAIYESLYYYDALFLQERFEITEEEVIRFLNSLIDHPDVSQVIKLDNDDQIRIWLCEQYLIFTNE